MHPNIITHGSLSALPTTVAVNAGNLSMLYEGGFLRYIKMGDTEIVRMINHTVRDCNWGTVPMVITHEKIECDDTHFLIEYEASCNQGDIDFVWNCVITGKADSSIYFSITGFANKSFKRNRIGFTLLHPIESCAGKVCTITHADNSKETLQFPEYISSTQPFFDVSAMHWHPANEINATIIFDGELFETEDQRNWLDASYKTYCTPLLKPFPVLVKEGEVIQQTIRLKVDTTDTIFNEKKQAISFTIDKNNPIPFPKIGLPLSKLAHDEQTINLIKLLGIDFLRVELTVNKQMDITALQAASEIISTIKCVIELVLFFEDNLNTDFIQQLLPFAKDIQQIIVLPLQAKCTDEKLIKHVVPLLRKHFPHCEIGAGTDAFFTELNRYRTPAEEIDFLTFSINPQVHAFDNSSLTETLKTHQYVVESCKQFVAGKAVHAGPVTFKMRWNPNATSSVTELPEVGQIPSNTDPRQLSLYGAAWALGSFKYLAESKVNSITYFETCGWAGLMPHVNEPWPEEFGVQQKCVYPVYLILKEILAHKKKLIMPLLSSDPLIFNGVAFVDGEGNVTIVIANFSNEVQRIEIPEKIKVIDAKIMNASNILNYMLYPQHLENAPLTMVNAFIYLQPFELAILKCLD